MECCRSFLCGKEGRSEKLRVSVFCWLPNQGRVGICWLFNEISADGYNTRYKTKPRGKYRFRRLNVDTAAPYSSNQPLLSSSKGNSMWSVINLLLVENYQQANLRGNKKKKENPASSSSSSSSSLTNTITSASSSSSCLPPLYVREACWFKVCLNLCWPSLILDVTNKQSSIR